MQHIDFCSVSTFPVVEDLTLHDSQMVSQEISIDDDDPEEHVHGELASAVWMFACYVYFMMTCLYIHVHLQYYCKPSNLAFDRWIGILKNAKFSLYWCILGDDSCIHNEDDSASDVDDDDDDDDDDEDGCEDGDGDDEAEDDDDDDDEEEDEDDEVHVQYITGCG